jgi:hypothetical protein
MAKAAFLQRFPRFEFQQSTIHIPKVALIPGTLIRPECNNPERIISRVEYSLSAYKERSDASQGPVTFFALRILAHLL